MITTPETDLFGNQIQQPDGGGVVAPRLVRCVSLWQPWASLIAAEIKTVETRSWPAPSTIIGVRIGIHAAKTTKGLKQAAGIKPLWKSCLDSLPWDQDGDLPRGAVVATAVVEASVPTERLDADIYGDYRPGRFGWVLSGVEPLSSPIPAKGMQGIFTADLSANGR